MKTETFALLKQIDEWLPYADEESGILASLLRKCRAEIECLSQSLAENTEMRNEQ